MLVSKIEMSRVLGISLPTLNQWIARHPAFPIVTRGTHGRAYEFEPEVVSAFVAELRQSSDRAAREREALLDQFALPIPALADDRPAGLSARERLDLARARALSREEAVASGRLVDARHTARAVADVLGRLGAGQRAAVRQILRAHDAPDAAITAIEGAFTDLQRRAVAALGADLAPVEPASPVAERAPRPELRLVG